MLLIQILRQFWKTLTLAIQHTSSTVFHLFRLRLWTVRRVPARSPSFWTFKTRSLVWRRNSESQKNKKFQLKMLNSTGMSRQHKRDQFRIWMKLWRARNGVYNNFYKVFLTFFQVINTFILWIAQGKILIKEVTEHLPIKAITLSKIMTNVGNSFRR